MTGGTTGADAGSPCTVDRVDEASSEAVDDGFDALYRQEYSKLVRIAQAMCGRRDVAEEVVQDAMVKVLARWRRVRAYDNPAAYCRRVVVNEAIGAWRRRASEARALGRVESPSAIALPPEVEEVWRHVRSLPRRQAQTVVLFYVDDLPTLEIATILRTSDANVRASLSKARTALKALLEGVDDE